MSAWIRGKSKGYIGLDLSSKTSENIAKHAIDKEHQKPTLPFFIFAFIFLILFFFTLLFRIDTSGGRVEFEIAKIISYRGGLCGLFFLGAIFCIWRAEPHIKISK